MRCSVLLRLRAMSVCLAASVCVGIVASALVGCAAPETPAMRAERVTQELMVQDPQLARFAVDLATRSESPFARKLLVESLDSADMETALLAVKRLADSSDADAAATLREVFANKPGSLRLTAAVALARGGDAEALEWLKGQLGTLTGAAQRAALVELARLDQRDAVMPVIKQLTGSKELADRDAAYAILGEIRQPWATKLLIEGLGKEHGEDRLGAVVALTRCGDPDVAPRIAKFVNTRGLVLESIEGLGALGNPSTRPALEGVLRKPEPLLKVYAGVALWRMDALGQPEQQLGPLVVDADAHVRKKLAEQLAHVQDSTALSFLLTLVEDDDPEVRAAAVRSLAAQADPGTVPSLLARVDDPEYTVSTIAIEALGHLGSPSHAERLAALLENENPYIGLSAAQALIEIEHRHGGAEAAT